ncbi:DNA cytosine methyltransferase [Planomonospora algeriensis]
MSNVEKPLKALEICAGAGGQALGLEKAGFEHELAIELDTNAVNTLRRNRPGWKVLTGDVADPKVWNPADHAPGSGLTAVDLLAGGVPCPPFTIAGKQLGAADERDLFAWTVEQVKIIQPRALLLENVRGLSMPRFAGYRQHVLDRLREFGYAAEWKLLQASWYGVPQLRPRFVLVAMRPEDFSFFHWPEPSEKKLPTVGEALYDLMAANQWPRAEEWRERANDIAPTIVGGSKKHGGADLGPTRAKRAWEALWVDAHVLANEAPYTDKDISPRGPRLTCEMVKRIQGWDDDEFAWEFTGRKTSNYRQIGNAFPPPVAKALGVSIAAALNRMAQKRDLDLDGARDEIYAILRDMKGDFVTTAQIARAIKLDVDDPEIDRRISLLSRDFEIIKDERKTGLAYKLGEFRAFTGQADHTRHTYFRENLSKVS